MVDLFIKYEPESLMGFLENAKEYTTQTAIQKCE
jgi:hypothetical protein